MKKLTGYTLLLCGLIGLTPTDLLGQDSQYVPTQEEMTEALDVFGTLIHELESASPSEDGNYYTLSLEDAPIMAAMGPSVFHIPLKEGTRARTDQLGRQLRATQIRNERVREEVTEELEDINRRMERSEQANRYMYDLEDLSEKDHQFPSTYRGGGAFIDDQISRDERQRLGLTRRQARRSLRSVTLRVWKDIFSDIARVHDINGQVVITYEAQNSRFRKDIVIDTQRSFFHFKNPVTSIVHSTSFQDMLDGQPVILGESRTHSARGMNITEDFRKKISEVPKSTSGRVLRINRLQRGFVRAVRGLGLFVGIPYLLFISDTLKEPRSWALTEIAILLNIPTNTFENGLDGLRLLLDDFISSQQSENDSDHFPFEEEK